MSGTVSISIPLHVRHQVRAAAAAALVAGVPSVGGRVYPGRSRPLDQDKLPCILVYTPDSPTKVLTPGAAGKGTQERHLALQVTAVVATDSDDYEADLDALDVLIEAALFAPAALGPARTPTLNNNQHATDQGGEITLARSTHDLTAIVYTLVGQPNVNR